MKSFDKYKTLDGSNVGAVCQLKDPHGKETGDWIRVRGIDSTEFQKANRNFRRAVMEHVETNGGEAATKTEAYQDFMEEQKLKLQAVLVMGWSFSEACEEANVIDLLRQAPDVANQIDTFASKRSRFVASSQVGCEPSLNDKSDLPSPHTPEQT